ncbi:hypothetical protein AGMMS50262_24110 [Bacteroidia bacterium]|nr:hypothetical protein AGMMS50262_24110 [Bacteroidia bacterium]
MVRKVILFSTLLAMLVCYEISYSQTESKFNENGSTLLCNECDSLYSKICSANPNIFGGHPQHFPQFPGGDEVLLTFIKDNIKYPSECKEQGIQGRVIVQFIINEMGKISCPRIYRSLHPAADEEALRVVKIMPDWKPASNNGIPCKMCYTLPIIFKL